MDHFNKAGTVIPTAAQLERRTLSLAGLLANHAQMVVDLAGEMAAADKATLKHAIGENEPLGVAAEALRQSFTRITVAVQIWAEETVKRMQQINPPLPGPSLN